MTSAITQQFSIDYLNDACRSTYCWVMGLFSLPMWINKSPIWTNPFLSISPFLWGKYKPILGLIFTHTQSFSATKKREREQFSQSKFSPNSQLQIAIPASFLVRLSWFFDSILSSSQYLIRNWQSWIWWPAASFLLSWIVAAKLVILLL